MGEQRDFIFLDHPAICVELVTLFGGSDRFGFELFQRFHIRRELAQAFLILGWIQSRALGGMDSLLSIVQMPSGIPVATFAIGVAGAKNAALFAAALLADAHPAIGEALAAFRRRQTQDALDGELEA